MKIGVVPGVRYYKKQKQYYTTTSYHKDMWMEYLDVFNDVLILAQAQKTIKVEDGFKPVLDKNIEFLEYPWAKGVLTTGCRLPAMFLRAYKASQKADVWLLHAPSFETIALWPWLIMFNKPYALILRGEQTLSIPYLKMRGIKNARFVTWVFKTILWLQRSSAVACVGVARYLSETYRPLGRYKKIYAISDNRIPLDMYRTPKSFSDVFKNRNIICLGRVEGQKNPIGMIKALTELDKLGFKKWQFTWVGDGPLKEKAQKVAKELGLEERVRFLGFVPWDNIFDILEKSDLYILNSVSEGMPRAMLEAMACALPCIGTNICGIPELLDPEDMVPIMADRKLALKMYEVLNDAKRLNEMSFRNLERAKDYSSENLIKKQNNFYRDLKNSVVLNDNVSN